MAGLPEVIGLLYRADWTRLSLSAEVRFEQDGDLARRRENAVRTESMRRMGFRPGLPACRTWSRSRTPSGTSITGGTRPC